MKLKYNKHRTSTQACSFLTPVNFLFTHFSHLSWINSSGLFSTTGSNDNYPLIHTQRLVNSNKVIPATQAHECRPKTNRSQLNSLSPSPSEEMPQEHVLAMTDTTLVLSGILFRLLKFLILPNPKPLWCNSFLQNPQNERDTWKLKITHVIVFLLTWSHTCSHAPMIYDLHLPHLDLSEDPEIL